MSEKTKISAAAHARLTAEIAELEGEGRREVAARIKTAREWGDLKENAEYHAAKDDAAMLEAKIARLREQLIGSEIVEAAAAGDGAGMGSTVTFTDAGTGKEMRYTLVSAPDADLAAKRLSIDSPLGQALADAKEGDSVSWETPGGERTGTVLAVSHS